jgi:hypothetical protein
MARDARTYLIATLILLVPAVCGAEPKRNTFGNRVHAALAKDGVTSGEIADGTIGCADLSSEVFPNGCPGSDADVGAPAASNVFVDGFTQVDKDLPSTPSGNDRAASIAQLEIGEGDHVVFASIVWSASPLDFSGIVTCHLVPPNQGPNSKAEFIGTDTTTGTLFAQTTATGPGVVDFRCSDQDATSTVKYRFLQLTAIRVGTLARTKLP